MLSKIDISEKSLEDFSGFYSEQLYGEIKRLAKELKGLKVVHINATREGGGPADILASLVPLMRGVGLEADWYVIPSHPKFSKVLLTKKIHNALQGGGLALTKSEQEDYIEASKFLADMAKDIKPDVWVLHDPQALGAVHFLAHKGKARILRIHVDLTSPNKRVWDFLEPYIKEYDKVIFSIPEFIPPDFPKDKAAVFTPTIDPLIEKNRKMEVNAAKVIVESFGINVTKPLLVNISRFDFWKDPIGMIEAYYKAKNEIPDLQFALIGLMIAADDPASVEIFEKVKRHTKGDPDLFLFSNPNAINDLSVSTFVRSFQTAADVIIHKSIREGFGMVVTEEMLKGKPVVAGNVGGLKVQITDGKSGFLVDSSDEAAERIVQLFKDPALRAKIGEAAEKKARDNFLTPRALRNYLKLFTEVI